MSKRETPIIRAENVEAFLQVQVAGGKCAFKECKRAGNVKLFWRRLDDPDHAPQRTAFICTRHGFDLANQVIGVYKFNQRPVSE